MFGARDVAGSIRFLAGLLALLLLLSLARETVGQEPKNDPKAALSKSINWKQGPCKAKIGMIAEIEVPEGYMFVEQKDMNKFNELNQNPPNFHDLGALVPTTDSWVVVFSNYVEEGHVKDDEKTQLDANALLESVRAGTEQQNQVRKQRGWPALTIVGWEQAPFYDEATKNCSWAIKATSEGQPIINYISKLLSRQGHLTVNLIVSDSAHLKRTLPTYKSLLGKFQYVPGQRYDEWKPGDKVAAYGLAALVGGGAVAVMAKTGILAKLIKPIIVGIVMLFGGIGAFFRKIFRRTKADA